MARFIFLINKIKIAITVVTKKIHHFVTLVLKEMISPKEFSSPNFPSLKNKTPVSATIILRQGLNKVCP